MSEERSGFSLDAPYLSALFAHRKEYLCLETVYEHLTKNAEVSGPLKDGQTELSAHFPLLTYGPRT